MPKQQDRIADWISDNFVWLVLAIPVACLLLFAATALAHNPVGSASQVCNEDGTVTLTASFENEGFDGETSVTATDSQAGDLGVGTSPATFSSDFPGPDRDAGTVTFDWSADNGHEGSVGATYEAMSDCEAPPVTPPPDNPPPPENPPEDEVVSGGPDKPSPPDKPAASPPADTLPLTGAPVVPVLMVGLGLLGAGIAIRRLHRG